MRWSKVWIAGRDPHRNSMDRTFVSYPKWHEAGVRIIAFNSEVEGGDPIRFWNLFISTANSWVLGCPPFLDFHFILSPYMLLIVTRFAVQIKVEGVDFMTSRNVRSWLKRKGLPDDGHEILVWVAGLKHPSIHEEGTQVKRRNLLKILTRIWDIEFLFESPRDRWLSFDKDIHI